MRMCRERSGGQRDAGRERTQTHLSFTCGGGVANVRRCTLLCDVDRAGSSRRELHAAMGRRRREAAEQRASERTDWENISRARSNDEADDAACFKP